MNLSDQLSIGKKLEAFLSHDNFRMEPYSKLDAVTTATLEKQNAFKSYIKDAEPNHLYLIGQPPVEEETLRRSIIEGAILKLHVFTGQGQIQFKAIVKKRQDKGLIGYWVYIPPDTPFKYVQRREYVRVSTWDDVTLQIYNVSTGEFSHTINGRAHNISGNGARFSAPQGLTPGTKMGLILHTEVGDFRLWGDIIYCHKNQNDRAPAKEQYISAMHFLDVPPDIERKLVQYCFKLELEREGRHKG